MGTFFHELKRRNVVRVGVAYVVVGWLVVQITETLLPTFGAPAWVFKTLVLLVGIGFPFALLFAWAFELTSEGIKKTRDVDLSASLTHSTGRRLDFMIIGALVIALGYFVYDRQGLIDASHNTDAVSSLADTAEIKATPDEIAAPDTVADTPLRRSIAVLPFLNLSSDNEQEWFADGLTEEILNSLARTPDLLVSARTSSFIYKGSGKSATTIAEELGVEHILEGSVRRAGERLRVTAQLIRAEDGFHLWSQTYDRTLDDAIQIQEDIAVEIAQALETAMDPEALAKMMSAGTRSVPAFEAYLQGLAYGISSESSGDAYEFLGARDAFERAIGLDPEFARAYWELAIFWGIQLSGSTIASGITELAHENIRANYDDAIDKAIRFENDPVSVLGYRADKAARDMKLAQALRLSTEDLAQRPNDQAAQLQQMFSLWDLRQYEQAIEAGLTFFERDGHDSLVTSVTVEILQYSKDAELKKSFTQKAVQRFGDHVGVLYQAHRTLLTAGDIDGASRILPIIETSDLSEDVRYLAKLRQACAERRLGDAEKLVAANAESLSVETREARFMRWLTDKIMGDDAAALAELRELDNGDDHRRELADYFDYGALDVRDFPRQMTYLASQGGNTAAPYVIPYRCKR